MQIYHPLIFFFSLFGINIALMKKSTFNYSYALMLFSVLMFALVSCKKAENSSMSIDSSSVQILQALPSNQTKVNFNNKVIETQAANSANYEGFLQGAGVAMLDVNNDGLEDIYFAGNTEGDRLYLNKGNFEFEDITIKSGIHQNKNWSTGLSVVDINADGYDDIYVCKFLFDNKTALKNVFYINNKDGSFTDQAAQLGVDDAGYSIAANFFDYDRDGDLDLYVANQPPNSLSAKGALKGKKDFQYTDNLYRNDGQRFTKVTEAAGIKNYTYSLSATSFDYNQDGWIDLYVTSDYEEPDFLWKNNGDGTFTDVSKSSIKHMSNFSMGADIADINNDGYEDLYTVDMVGDDNYRQKTSMSGMNPKKFWALVNAGYHYQYMFNALQLNNGDGSFSEVAQMAGVSNTDWSWAPLFQDLDNDGNKDLVVTNGVLRDYRNKDWEIWKDKYIAQLKADAAAKGTKASLNIMDIVNKVPTYKTANQVYKNAGDLSFTKMNDKWGFDQINVSSGAAFGDLDNDGDMDLVINNMNQVAEIYRNSSNENKLNNYISISLEGIQKNIDAYNASIQITTNEGKQIQTYTPFRGYMSSSQKRAHFGLGSANQINELKVIWPNAQETILREVKVNQHLVIAQKNAKGQYQKATSKKLFANLPTDIKHQENDFDDYKREILIPYKTSALGPIMAKGDVNGDGNEDLYLGGSAGFEGQLLLAKTNGKLEKSNQAAFKLDKEKEDGGASFVDIDKDGDLDLIVNSGGNEFLAGSAYYEDRLYLNDGSGKFKRTNHLKDVKISTVVSAAYDYDQDGDLDLFIGGRQIPGKYGFSENSLLMEQQDNGSFKNVTDQKAEGLQKLGMVTDAAWVDIDKDGKAELAVVGEWMPISIFSIDGGKLENQTSKYGLEDSQGWWNTIEVNDIDEDGDPDLVIGNLGLNTKYKASESEPFKLYVDDFDGNGTHDVYLGYFDKDGKCYPVRGRQCSSEQMPFVKKKFASYSDFAVATIDEVLEGKINEESVIQHARKFESCILKNNGSGNFDIIDLPRSAQVSPIYGIEIDDFNGDGKKDIMCVGNLHVREVETTRSDASKGVLLLQNDTGGFDSYGTDYTGINADGDARAVQQLKLKNGKSTLVIANNNAPIQMYRLK